MPIPERKKELIALQVIRTLYSRFETFPETSADNRNAPFHMAFLNAFSNKFEDKVTDIPFFISMSSWLHGLNTTLGQSFFESVAHILSDGEKKDFTKQKNSLLQVTQNQKNNVADIITDLKNGDYQANLSRENQLIFLNDGDDIDANNFTADVFIEDDDKIKCIELKSVKPNAGEMRGEKQKILEAKSALYKAYPNKQIEYYIGFPFDPTSSSAFLSDKTRFLNSIIDGNKYYDQQEVLLADELWDFLSSDINTMSQIIDIINTIATPEFENKYSELLNSETTIERRRTILSEWNLHSELRLIDNDRNILRNISGNRSLMRVYKNSMLKKGLYNFERFVTLNKIITSID